jgi:hypothetical protein
MLCWTYPDDGTHSAAASAIALNTTLWTQYTLSGSSQALVGFAFEPVLKRLCAAAINGFSYSLDNGASWLFVAKPAGLSANLTDIACYNPTAGSTVWMAVDASGHVGTATDPSVWTFVSSLGTAATWKLAHGLTPAGASIWFAYSQRTAASTAKVLYSLDDGATWTDTSAYISARNVSRLAQVNGLWLMTSMEAPYLWASHYPTLETGGEAWWPVWLGVDEQGDAKWGLFDILHNDGQYLALSSVNVFRSARAADTRAT